MFYCEMMRGLGLCECDKSAEEMQIASLITQQEFMGIIQKQFRKEIKKINKSLKESLKRTPIGEGSAKVSYKSEDMRNAIRSFYEAQGYNVTENKWHDLTISVKGWAGKD